MRVVATGGGREYIVVLLGEGPEAGQFYDDAWAYQVPAQGMTTASAIDRFSKVLRRKSGEGRWYRVQGRAFDEDDVRAASGPGPRGWAGVAGFADENAIVVWGGVDEAGRKLGDGWILRLD
ncbi:hypothetical protein MCOR02_003306 [Pyricularia oryzae]|nr:hypothetical protein MCOR02_003306 [Pyricularia oryzae]